MSSIFAVRNSQNEFLYNEWSCTNDDQCQSNILYDSMVGLAISTRSMEVMDHEAEAEQHLARILLETTDTMASNKHQSRATIVRQLILNIFSCGIPDIVQLNDLNGGVEGLEVVRKLDTKTFIVECAYAFLGDEEWNGELYHSLIIDDIMNGTFGPKLKYFIDWSEDTICAMYQKATDEELTLIKMKSHHPDSIIIIENTQLYLDVVSNFKKWVENACR